MTPEQLQQIHANRQSDTPDTIDLVAMMEDRRDRTLIYGYDCERRTHHVYLEDGVIHHFVYNGIRGDVVSHRSGPEVPFATLVPDKRAYPERCDFEFCALLERLGKQISFTTHEPKNLREGETFHGRRHGDAPSLDVPAPGPQP